ncbi:MAG: mannose-6-phosphate isomerase, class I [Lentisphaeria bacterium]|nr:mannose-6-phosphate isomerase, class I [Lentisphaeria bacterium]
MSSTPLLKLTCGVQHYDWGMTARDGNPPFIAKLLGQTAEPDQPFAELWIGGHDAMQSQVSTEGGDVGIATFIKDHPENVLGETLAGVGMRELPFLLKVLSCERALSIQAHPDRETAQRLHAENPVEFPDANHKPEIAIAITPFQALSHFRPYQDIAQELERLASLSAFFAGVEDVKSFWTTLFDAPENDLQELLIDLREELSALPERTEQDVWFVRLSKDFPGDRGALCVYLLNLVTLQPGEALFHGPNEPHSYLDGTIIECMANSNNVVRAGLTKKAADADLLAELLAFAPQPPNLVKPQSLADGAVMRYTVPAGEFLVDIWQPSADKPLEQSSEDCASALLVLDGAARLIEPDGTTHEADGGSAWLWPATVTSLRMETTDANTRIVRATPNLIPFCQQLGLPTPQRKTEDSDSLDQWETMAAEAGGSDFGALFEKGLSALKTDFNVGDRIEGVVTSVGKNTVFVDVGGRADGVIDTSEFLDEEGNVAVAVGDQVKAFCAARDEDGVRLTTKMTGKVADAGLLEAHENSIPVEGRVESERKGGFEVKIAGQKAFCPYSQIDTFKQDSQIYIGAKFPFIITEYSANGRNLVVSRRRLLEREQLEEKKQLQEELAEGAILTGTVSRVLDFGAFVSLGGGIDGLVHVSELGWGRNLKPEEIVNVGQTVEVTVLTIDWEKDRISLSLRRAEDDPWTKLGNDPDYIVGRRCSGVVTKLMPFGAFVELEPGLEGLIHISKLGAGRRLNHPSEVLDEGETVEVTIVNIDHEQRRIALSREDTSFMDDGDAPVGGEQSGELRVGGTYTGIVENIRPFGVFVRLAGDRTGLLHISQIELRGSSNPMRALHDMFPPESKLEVVLKEIKGDRLSLTLRETLDKESEKIDPTMLQDSDGGSLGSLDGLFGNLEL